MPSKHSISYLIPLVNSYKLPHIDVTCSPIRGYLDLELRGLLLAIDDRALGVRGLEILSQCMDNAVRCSAHILVKLDTWAQLVWIV